MPRTQILKPHHLYLGIGGAISVAALVIALTFGLSSAKKPDIGLKGYGGDISTRYQIESLELEVAKLKEELALCKK